MACIYNVCVSLTKNIGIIIIVEAAIKKEVSKIDCLGNFSMTQNSGE